MAENKEALAADLLGSEGGPQSKHIGRDEILAYYDRVMQQTFLTSGRVQYFPKHEYLGYGTFRSLLTGKEFYVDSQTKIVDGTYAKVSVPLKTRTCRSGWVCLNLRAVVP